MKRFKYIPTIFLAAGLACVFYACCRDDDNTCSDPTNPECENYDPCYGETPVTAEFKIFDEIYQSGPQAGTWYEDDVIWDGSY